MTIEEVAFEGHGCVRLQGGAGEVYVTTTAGPRILGLFGAGDNLLAVVPGSTIERADGPAYRLIGGHRLWAAPEVPEITYAPDDRPCTVTQVEGGVRVEAPVDVAGLARAIEVRPSPEGWIVDHQIRNASDRPITLAPWAITQVPLGGQVCAAASTDATGPQADRALVLWPYSDPGDARLHLGPDEVRVDAVPGRDARRLKIGLAPSRGQVAYDKDGERFEKRVTIQPDASHADLGAAVQIFLSDDFCEMETLGPLQEVSPQGLARHRERWIVGPRGEDG